MRYNKTAVINLALRRVAAPGATSSYEDSPAASSASAAYDASPHFCLSQYNWAFATREKSLAQSASETSARYNYIYPLPVDCLRIVSLRRDTHRKIERYDVLGLSIHTDSNAALLTYISADAAETMPDAFASALAYLIAVEISPYVEHGGTDIKAYYQLHEQALDMAKTWNDQQIPVEQEYSHAVAERFR